MTFYDLLHHIQTPPAVSQCNSLFRLYLLLLLCLPLALTSLSIWLMRKLNKAAPPLGRKRGANGLGAKVKLRTNKITRVAAHMTVEPRRDVNTLLESLKQDMKDADEKSTPCSAKDEALRGFHVKKLVSTQDEHSSSDEEVTTSSTSRRKGLTKVGSTALTRLK